LKARLALLVVPLVVLLGLLPAPAGAATLPQGTQSDGAFAKSYQLNHVANVEATTQATSCYTPEVPYSFVQTAEGYSGESPCNGASTTGEALGPYPTQAGSAAGYPATTPMLVKGHSESNIVVDPSNPNHLIGSSKWFVSQEGYNHLLGFYESFDGGKTWPNQGHIPGYEGWTDNTDPVGAFDGFGNYYEFVLGYQFYYNANGSHNFDIGTHAVNPSEPQEVVSVAVRPKGSTGAGGWKTTVNGQPDFVASYQPLGREPDKQWITIDDNPASPNYNTIYAMWVVFNFFGSKPYYSTAKALPDGSHTPWTTPVQLPTVNNSASDTYLLPHVDGNGTVWTAVSNFPSKQSFSTYEVYLDFSTDGGKTFNGPLVVTPTQNTVLAPYCCYSNTNTRSGISDTFAIGPGRLANGSYPLYVSWEDYSTGYSNLFITASNDGGNTWSAAEKVNDNVNQQTDEFQPNLAASPNGTVSVAFYDRRLPCPSAGTTEAAAAGLALDTNNPHFASLPPYGAANYCANGAVQFYDSALNPKGNNIRLSAHSFDPELNAALYAAGTDISRGFLGDYFGHADSATLSFSSFVTTYDDGTNPFNRQQQLIATLAVP
jgi:hypothetical protein